MRQRFIQKTVLDNRWIPHVPTPQQGAFLSLPCLEATYGGAAGGGKSDALLMGALQFVDVPGYAALLLRRTYGELALADGLMTRAHEWLGGTAAKWDDGEHTYTFPSGSTLTFGYMDSVRDKFRYQGAAYQYIGWDEQTQFRMADYQYMFSRTRRLAGLPVPIRVRGATNPGGIGHQWVYDRFIAPGPGRLDCVFIPARLQHNPHLDQATYIQSLNRLDPIMRQQLLEGLWVVDTRNKPWLREWWAGRNRYDPREPRHANDTVARYISWDTGLKETVTSAYSVGLVGEITPAYQLRLREVYREQMAFPSLVDRIIWQADRYRHDDNLRAVIIEDRVSGTSALQTLQLTGPEWLKPLLVGFPAMESKDVRDQLAGVWGRLGCILLPMPDESVPWLYDFESELFSLPNTEFRDQGDAFSQIVDFSRELLAEHYRMREGIAA